MDIIQVISNLSIQILRLLKAMNLILNKINNKFINNNNKCSSNENYFYIDYLFLKYFF